MPTTSEIVQPNTLDPSRRAIFEALSAIPEYESYRDSTAVAEGFAQLCDEHAKDPNIIVRLENIRPDEEKDESLNALVVELPDAEELEDPSTALLIGNVHSNELVWTLTFDFLPRLLSEHPDLMRQLGLKRIIFLDAAPHATDVNGDALLRGRGDLTVRDYYRSAFRSHEQPDWDLTVNYADFTENPAEYSDVEGYLHKSSLLGARVAEKLLERYRPELVHTLHNAGIDGLYTFISRLVGALADDMEMLRQAMRPKLPLGGSESIGEEPLALGIYPSSGAKEIYKSDGIGGRLAPR